MILLALVSQWMSSGTLSEYLDEQATIVTPSARIGLVSRLFARLLILVLLGQGHIAEGLIILGRFLSCRSICS